MFDNLLIWFWTIVLIGVFWKPQVKAYQRLRGKFPWIIRVAFSAAYVYAAYIVATYITPWTYKALSYINEWTGGALTFG